jgi:hypothetical protein
MPPPIPAWRKILKQPGLFTLQVLKAFQKNQGLLLSGALAYYILLSIIPLLTFLLLMLSHVVDEAALTTTLRRYIGLVIPGDSEAILGQVRSILEGSGRLGRIGLHAFFSSLAFSVPETPCQSSSFIGSGTTSRCSSPCCFLISTFSVWHWLPADDGDCQLHNPWVMTDVVLGRVVPDRLSIVLLYHRRRRFVRPAEFLLKLFNSNYAN